MYTHNIYIYIDTLSLSLSIYIYIYKYACTYTVIFLYRNDKIRPIPALTLWIAEGLPQAISRGGIPSHTYGYSLQGGAVGGVCSGSG